MAEFIIPDLPVTPSLADWTSFSRRCEEIHEQVTTELMVLAPGVFLPPFPVIIPETSKGRAGLKTGEIGLQNHLVQIIDTLKALCALPEPPAQGLEEPPAQGLEEPRTVPGGFHTPDEGLVAPSSPVRQTVSPGPIPPARAATARPVLKSPVPRRPADPTTITSFTAAATTMANPQGPSLTNPGMFGPIMGFPRLQNPTLPGTSRGLPSVSLFGPGPGPFNTGFLPPTVNAPSVPGPLLGLH
jgi:hypothetical protein